MPNSFTRIVRRVVRRFGYDIVPYTITESAHAQRARLLSDHKITLVFDVGANVGQFGRLLRMGGYKARIVSVEPGTAAFKQLERAAHSDPHWSVVNCALGEHTGSATLHVSANSESSSLRLATARLQESAPEAQFIQEETVKVRTLDDLVTSCSTPDDRLFVKLDVQGFERDVLAGGRKAIARASLLQLEVAINSMYEGEAMLPEMLAYVQDQGMRLTHIAPVFKDPRSGELLEVDMLAFRP